MCHHPDITEGMCLYASEIFRLQETFALVPSSELEYSLNVSAQAVARMLRRMKAAGLVEHVRYKGVRLTPEGRAAALPCIRRHRLAEVFLVEVMGFGWDEVHDLADRFVFDGPVRLRYDGSREAVLGQAVASALWVELLE